MIDPKKNAELFRTPFTKQSSGRWSLFLIEGKELEYGHRFDAGIGYRVYIKFKDSWMSNTFPAGEAKRLATMMENRKYQPGADELTLAGHIRAMAAQVDALNKAWAALGAPDEPLDKMAGGTA